MHRSTVTTEPRAWGTDMLVRCTCTTELVRISPEVETMALRPAESDEDPDCPYHGTLDFRTEVQDFDTAELGEGYYGEYED